MISNALQVEYYNRQWELGEGERLSMWRARLDELLKKYNKMVIFEVWPNSQYESF